MEILNAPQGDLQLSRYPLRANDKLRAWDAADEYLLNYVTELAEQQWTDYPKQVLVLNDTFGALATALTKSGNSAQITAVSDSYLSHKGTIQNLTDNQLPIDTIQLHSSLDWPDQPMNLVLIKTPRSLSLLEDQLHRLQAIITDQTIVVAAGMVKNIHNSTLALFEKIIGPTKTSLAKKKARLIFPTIQPSLKSVEGSNSKNPYPISYQLDQLNQPISNHANVFSREKLDIGTRFLIEHIPVSERYKNIIDLGCGNGLVGILAAQKNPQAELVFTDESFMAIASAQQNFSTFLPDRTATFHIGDCLEGVDKTNADLIINNPPFHQQTAVSGYVAEQMFAESKDALKTGGELWVIGNRHLQYEQKLKRLFGNCQTVVTNSKFEILKVVKR